MRRWLLMSGSLSVEVILFSKIALAMGLLLRGTALTWGHHFLTSMFSIVPLSPGVPVCAAWFCSRIPRWSLPDLSFLPYRSPLRFLRWSHDSLFDICLIDVVSPAITLSGSCSFDVGSSSDMRRRILAFLGAFALLPHTSHHLPGRLYCRCQRFGRPCLPLFFEHHLLGIDWLTVRWSWCRT
jgi:hypothetical protein